MNKIKKSIVAVAVLAAFPFAVMSADPLANFIFDYETSGSRQAKPLQVFDDGAYTYFQFRQGEPVPAVFIGDSEGSANLAIPEQYGPYFRIPIVAERYHFKMGSGLAKAYFSGQRKDVVKVKTVEKPTTVSVNQTEKTPSTEAVKQVRSPATRFDQQGDGHLVTVQDQMRKLGLMKVGHQEVAMKEPPPRIAVDVNSYAQPYKGDIAQFQPKGAEPVVSTKAPVTLPDVKTSVPFLEAAIKLGPRGRAAVAASVSSFKAGDSVEVVGLSDKSLKEGVAGDRAKAIVAELNRLGIPSSAIAYKVGQGVATGAGKVVDAGLVTLKAGRKPAHLPSSAMTEDDLARALDAITSRLRAGRLTPAQAAQEVQQVQSMLAKRYVQPVAGFEEVQITRWSLRKADATVQSLFERWARDAGWELVWKNAPDIPVTGDAELVRDGFVAAADYVLAQARTMGFNIKGRAFNNKVLVITAE